MNIFHRLLSFIRRTRGVLPEPIRYDGYGRPWYAHSEVKALGQEHFDKLNKKHSGQVYCRHSDGYETYSVSRDYGRTMVYAINLRGDILVGVPTAI